MTRRRRGAKFAGQTTRKPLLVWKRFSVADIGLTHKDIHEARRPLIIQ
jgi:hypothetical protein